MIRLTTVAILSLIQIIVGATPKYQRFFVNTKAINFVDPTKHGFRVVLMDAFLQEYLSPTQIPTLFISAIPLRRDEPPFTKVLYPDNIRDDKQVNLSELRERSWYYVCVEWENFNRHNESTGTDCRILRTLDRFGKSADTTVSDIEILDIGATTMQFRVRSLVDFPMRLTASLQGGSGPLLPSQVFNYRESSDLEITFAFLRQDADYGQLCILEEPLVTGYSAMSRLVAGIYIEKCYFGKLRTKDYELSTFDSEASPYKRAASASTTHSVQYLILLLLSSCFVTFFSITHSY
ncbi:unnamed protein product [Anisakis simplex]|uniref:Uncharacterized protein n=1 Tax=Anisakis simplex TaxID=6269 RepID=A0A0M3JX33_ANISI|nr:unnamed protein product [Anisakis simplex]